MKVREIRDRADWLRLEPVWNPLLEASSSATTFLTWEWMAAWWSAYGTEGELRVLTAIDDSGVIRGIAPLRRQIVTRYRQAYSSLSFIGDGSSDSDYLDFIVARGFEPEVIGAFLQHLERELRDGLILRLNEIPDESPNLRVLRELARNRCVWTEEPVPCAVVPLPGTWDDYLRMLRPRFRTRVRSVLRNLEGRPGIRFGFCERPEELDRLLDSLFTLHTRRWNEDGLPGVFGWDRKRAFYAELSRRLLARGSLRFSCLEWNGRILACQYGFVHGGSYLHLQEGYEPASEHWNVGIALRAWTIREFIRAGVRDYDFLAGVGRHKLDWGAGVKESRQIAFGARTARNLLFCRGPEWQARTKALVRNIIPERVLELRRARLQPPRVANPEWRESTWAERAGAQCYFHLGGPAAAAFVRRRYQLSVGSDGTHRRFSWMKRREPAGRILYYHRINDGRDPFFPSTPVDVFERHVRHVARHYKVVSLERLLEHLNGDDPETVVAITFDDGYRDNYENAWPILQRYGMVGTVFLSTGSLDSRDPLWFEVLAGALKTSAKEFLDLELDVPRRFWMRTPAERVAANTQLLRVLRAVPDAERQDHLTAILRELEPPEPGGLRDRMLTWNQVREMKRHGMDFGGHTVTHPFVSRLTRDRAAWEIVECKRRIESEIQAPVLHFAYPNGRDEDFAPWNKQEIRAAGYRAAVTTLWGLNYQSTDRLELRRGGPWEEDEALFAYKMDWYQLVND